LSSSLEFTRRSDSRADDFSRVRGKEVLEKLIAKHPEWEGRLELAHTTLASDPNYAAAMHAVARSLQGGRIKVFISYRSARDAAAAEVLASELSGLSGGRIEVTLAKEFASRIFGQNYKEEIFTRIQDAHWFFLLASDHSPNPWCMFETGMFRSTMISKRINRLICICHPGVTLPDPIHEFQAVEATPRAVRELFMGLFGRPEPLPGWEALNPHLATDSIESAAVRIAEAFEPPSAPVEFNRTVRLSIPHSKMLNGPGDLASSRIETDQITARLFGKTVPPSTWGELITSVERRNSTTKWLVELTEVLEKARRNDVFRPVSGTFESQESGKVVRPVLHSMEPSASETTFNLLFVEEICSAPTHRIPSRTLALLTSVRMNNRIRWEIVERFGRVKWEKDTVDQCKKAFSRIEREVDSFGRWDIDLLCSCFDPATEVPVIQAIISRWNELRASGAGGDRYMKGELDLAFDRYDIDQLPTLMEEVRQLNLRFLKLANRAMEALVEGNRQDLWADGGFQSLPA